MFRERMRSVALAVLQPVSMLRAWFMLPIAVVELSIIVGRMREEFDEISRRVEAAESKLPAENCHYGEGDVPS